MRADDDEKQRPVWPDPAPEPPRELAHPWALAGRQQERPPRDEQESDGADP